jgi:serine/threonine protein kinase
MMTGQTLGRYRIIEQLGQGGMATVYKAYDPELEKYVAIGIMREEFTRDPEFRKSFIHQNETSARLKHPHIVSILDYSAEGDRAYTVYQYREQATSLRDRLKAGPLSIEQANQILNQIASALDCAHAQGVIHRDVTPVNIAIDKEGDAYLTDFGMAITLDEEGETRKLDGTRLDANASAYVNPTYASPEQMMGNEHLTPAADLYSLGVVLYEMLTGRPPFSAAIPMALLLKKLNDPLPRPRDLRPDLPEAVEAVLFKALAKESQSRYQTAGSLAAAFSQAIKQSARPIPAETADSKAALKDTTPHHVTRPDSSVAPRRTNPWISGSFYLFAAVVSITLFAVISANVSWYALPVIFIGGILVISIIGALQLRNDDNLREENFLTLMFETFKRLPLLRSSGSSDHANDKPK